MNQNGTTAANGGTEDMAGSEKNDSTIPWGIYVPPSTGYYTAHDNDIAGTNEGGDDADTDKLPPKTNGGYVRIVDAKGKSFPCGFTQPIGSKLETIVRKKRKRPDDDDPTDNGCDGVAAIKGACGEDNQLAAKDETEVIQQRVTITEERLHPEEALFLHLRGLLRIESKSNGEESTDNKSAETSTLPTQNLFCNMLPQCKVPLAAYLAYAHLRAQGYILTRYTEQRMKLLRLQKEQQRQNEERQQLKEQQKLEDQQNPDRSNNLEAKNLQKDNAESSEATVKKCENEDKAPLPMDKEKPTDGDSEIVSKNDNAENDGDPASATQNNSRPKDRPLRSQLTDDVAAALPPCVASLESCGTTEKANIRLTYYAYNPNARFRRSNPGMPDFGVAVVPFQSGDGNGTPFATLNSLVSMCEGAEQLEDEEDGNEHSNSSARSGIPLRVVTVADGGAVIAFAVTNGDVPSINASM